MKNKRLLEWFEQELAKKDARIELQIKYLATALADNVKLKEDIDHRITMSKDELELKCEKKLVTLDRQNSVVFDALRERYRIDLRELYEKHHTRIDAMHSEILGRLPNYNVSKTE